MRKRLLGCTLLVIDAGIERVLARDFDMGVTHEGVVTLPKSVTEAVSFDVAVDPVQMREFLVKVDYGFEPSPIIDKGGIGRRRGKASRKRDRASRWAI